MFKSLEHTVHKQTTFFYQFESQYTMFYIKFKNVFKRLPIDMPNAAIQWMSAAGGFSPCELTRAIGKWFTTGCDNCDKVYSWEETKKTVRPH